MHFTYELYLEDPSGQRRFHALTCRERDVIREVRKVLAEQQARAAEVWRLGERLFTVEA